MSSADSAALARRGRSAWAVAWLLTLPLAAAWWAALAEWLWVESWREGQFLLIDLPEGLAGTKLLLWGVFLPSAVAGVTWTIVAARCCRRLPRSLVVSLAYLPIWQFVVFAVEEGALNGPRQVAWLFELRTSLAQAGTVGLFVIGLAWVVWFVESASRHYAARRRRTHFQSVRETDTKGDALAAYGRTDRKTVPRTSRIWNPFDAEAWYYGRSSKKLTQSLAAFLTYTVCFLIGLWLFSRIGGGTERFEMPAGGGGGRQAQLVQQVSIQKVVKKKYIVNPFSSIVFNPPPIDDVKLRLTEMTQHQYKAGQGAGQGFGFGDGAGAGFAGGTSLGKVRFIRLEYAGGDWSQDFGVGADVNMLIEYHARTSHQVADATESRTITLLGRAATDAAPPFVYMTGQKDISVSKQEVRILRDYLLEKHGMIFGDNGGSGHFHNQFFQMMRQVLPNVEPVRVALDDPIHMRPYRIPFLPYVAPHGGRDAWGWKVDGRWVCYYHPGDIGDAWSDEHAGIKPEITEYCYQLGTNVIFHAYMEYSKWLAARKQRK